MDFYAICNLWSDSTNYDIVGVIDGDAVYNCVSDL